MKDVCRRLSLLICALLVSAALGAAASADALPSAEPVFLSAQADAGSAQRATAAPEAAESETEAAQAEASPEARAAATLEPIASESAPATDAEPTPEPSASATPEVGAAATEPSAGASAEPSPEATAEPAPGATAASAAAQSDFSCGYARINGNVPAYAGAYPGAELDCYLTSGGVVYALSRRCASGCDRLECALDDGEGERRVWIDARWLYPLDSEAAQAFVQARLSEADVRCLSGEGLPLDRLSCAPAVRYQLGDEEIEAEPSDAPAMLLECAALTLRVGESAQLEVAFSDGGDYALSFMSRNSRVASVSDDGEVLARREGDTAILVRSELGAAASIRVTVVE